MADMYGYSGKILRVDLSRGVTSTDALDELFCRSYILGAVSSDKALGEWVEEAIEEKAAREEREEAEPK